MTFISKTAQAVMAMCRNAAGKKAVNDIDAKINELKDKKAQLTGKVSNVKSEAVTAKGKVTVTCDKQELLIDVAANVLVKDVCRNIERKLQRNLNKSDSSDWQLLYNHLHYYYSLKHVNTLPVVVGRNKEYHIDDYTKHRTTSVINDVTCHINFS